MKLLKAALAGLIKVFMAICMLLALFGIPYLIISTAWGWLVQLWHEHPVWCVLLVIPIVWLAYKVMKWALETTGHLMMGVGSIVDRLER
jgi:hypothetical protein